MNYSQLRKEYVDQARELHLAEDDESKQLAREMLIVLASTPDNEVQGAMFFLTLKTLLMKME